MIRCASVGLGWWGMLHAEASEVVDGMKLTTGLNQSGNAEVDAKAMAEFSSRFGGKQATSYEEILADPAIDAVLITTPDPFHVPQIVAAAQAGKHVFCEKPLAVTVEDGLKAIKACQEAGVVLAVGHNRRLSRAQRAIKAIIESGELGEILHIESHFSYPGGMTFTPGFWRASPPMNKIGVITASLIHMVDSCLHVHSPVKKVVGATNLRRAVPLDFSDTTAFLCEFESGASGYIGGTIAAADYSSLNFYGSKASIYAGIDEEEVTLHRRYGPREKIDLSSYVTPEGQALTQRQTEPRPPSYDTLAAELASFVRAVEGRQPFLITPGEALHNVAVMQSIVQSAATGKPVDIPQAWRL